MSQTPFPDRPTIEVSQLTQLRALLAVLEHTNQFYAPRLGRAQLGADIASLRDFTCHMPLTRKQDLVADQREHPPYGTNLTFDLHRYTRFNQTSATTGTPLRWLDTPESWAWMLDNWMRVYGACGVVSGDRILFAFSFGPFLGFWTAFEAALQMGCRCIPSGGMSSISRLKTMLDNEVTVLCCTPTYAIRLAQVASEAGLDLRASTIKVIIVAGEPGGSIPSTRAVIEGHWFGARVCDHHGMTEVGPVSFQCPARPCVLHVIEPAYLAEVIDPQTGQPVKAGQTGELILTTLGRSGSPLLRYCSGDIVRQAADGRCECGQFLMSLEGGILGRTDDMVLVRGVNVYPSAVDQIIRANSTVTEYRVEVYSGRGTGELRLQIEPEPTCDDVGALCERIRRDMRHAFQLRVSVQVVSPGQLPRFEMKAKRWVRISDDRINQGAVDDG